MCILSGKGFSLYIYIYNYVFLDCFFMQSLLLIPTGVMASQIHAMIVTPHQSVSFQCGEVGSVYLQETQSFAIQLPLTMDAQQKVPNPS